MRLFYHDMLYIFVGVKEMLTDTLYNLWCVQAFMQAAVLRTPTGLLWGRGDAEYPVCSEGC